MMHTFSLVTPIAHLFIFCTYCLCLISWLYFAGDIKRLIVSLYVNVQSILVQVQKQKNQLSYCSLHGASRCMELSSYAHTSCGTTCHSHHTAPCHSKNQASCNSTKCAQLPMPAHFEGSPALTLGILIVSFFQSTLPNAV